MHLIVNSDGGAKPNPGPAGYGVIIKYENNIICSFGNTIGYNTNNVAEYVGAIAGLMRAHVLGASEIVLYVDSSLVANQAMGIYKVNKPLRPYYSKLMELKSKVPTTVVWVPRSKNQQADAEYNKAMWENRRNDPRGGIRHKYLDNQVLVELI